MAAFTRSTDFYGNGIFIYREGKWWPLKLKGEQVIKYNAVINRIGRLDVREIGHSNTFSILPVSQNITALGLNFFNSQQLAIVLNGKFPAKYYVENKLLLEGFVVINNTKEGAININFIDEALEITDKWGATSFYSLLRSPEIVKPADYQAAIDEMTGYDMDRTSLLTPLSTVGSRGHNLAYFPNNLNTVGDPFQLDDDGNRIDDAFNPYQSRPIFNAKALFDLACESFGYTPEYTSSIDLDSLESTCIVGSKLGESQKPQDAFELIKWPVAYYNLSHYNSVYTYQAVFPYSEGDNVRTPNSFANWSQPAGFNPGYESKKCVFIPDIESSNIGSVFLKAEVAPSFTVFYDYSYSIWEDTLSSGVLFKSLPKEVDNSSSTNINMQFSKSEFELPPTNGGAFLGIICQRDVTADMENIFFSINNAQVTEQLIPSDIIVYDEYMQYAGESINLTHAAPQETIKTLLSAYMQKDGILMDINSKTKVVKFFTYGYYETQKQNGNYYDWSRYLRKYNTPLYNTDFGNNYYKRNKIALTESYTGNAYYQELTNQGFESKLKDSGENIVKNYKDVASIVSVNNSTVPYFEYKNMGLGLVELVPSLSGLTQVRADGSSQGSITNLKALANVNYTAPPTGVSEWYSLVDRAIKVEAKFLLPMNIIRELDLSKPVYIENLGGFYIIEEISEYINAQTIVNVKLIKLEIPLSLSPDQYQFEDLIDFNFEDSEVYQFDSKIN